MCVSNVLDAKLMLGIRFPSNALRLVLASERGRACGVAGGARTMKANINDRNERGTFAPRKVTGRAK